VTVLSPVRYAWRRGKEGLLYLRGRRILRRYTSHYQRVRKVFHQDGHPAPAAPYSPDSFGVRIVRGEPTDAIRLPAGYEALVDRVARSAADALAETDKCRFFPPLKTAAPGSRTPDLPDVRAGSVIAIQLLNPFELEGVRELCEPLIEQIEHTIYGSYAIVDKLYVYRTPISRQKPKTSWRWHFDNHPREMLKVMVYLTDVREDTAPFVYLRERATGRCWPGAPLAPLYGHSRVAVEEIDRRLDSGWEAHPVTGPRGTVLIFDDNIVHRGTLAQASHRDVIVFQIRPSAFKASPRIDPRWTGTFGHRDFHANPDELAPRPSA
jgi:hypothetical protein